MIKYSSFIFVFLCIEICLSQCDSSETYFEELPNNVSILVGDSCLTNKDIEVLDSIILINELDYSSPLELGTQTWFNGRLRFLVAGNYGNSSGVNDTIYTLPDNIGNLDDLASLYLEWNRITQLPESFKDMTNLFSLYLNNNILTSIIDSMGNLNNLYLLDLGYNEIAHIPATICELGNLSYLWLFNNELEQLPECFCNMDIDWNGEDFGGYPYFAIGANNLCDNIPTCVSQSQHFELSLDQFYYSFPVYSPQNCDSTITSLSFNQAPFPYQFSISKPYPNPFNPTVKLNLYIPHDRKMKIAVFDNRGRKIKDISSNSIYQKGTHIIEWNGKNHSSGIYYIKLSDGSEMKIQKMLLLK